MNLCKRQGVILLFVLGLKLFPAHGRFANPQPAPIERLLANVEAYVAEYPNDAHGHYILGRIHYMAFANRLPYAAQYGSQVPLPNLVWWWNSDGSETALRDERAQELALEEMGYNSVLDIPTEVRDTYFQRKVEYAQQLADQGYPPFYEPNETIAHAGLALSSFQTAVALDPNEPLYLLGVASLIEQYVTCVLSLDTGLLPQALAQILLSKARETYYNAYSMAIVNDLSLTHRPLHGLHYLVGYEAGEGFLRLLPPGPEPMPQQRRGQRPEDGMAFSTDHLSPELAQMAQAIHEDLVTLESLPRGAITPIVFTLDRAHSLDVLFHDSHTVLFDLDGDGHIERWPWIKPTTAFLVWDPQRSGRIKSGRQLFGTASWWLLFENGYQALDALDNNRDGALRGHELDGVRAWFDRNQDGQSQTAEVVDLNDLDIIGIATRPCGEKQGVLTHGQGIMLQDGRTVATYDWVAAPLPASIQ